VHRQPRVKRNSIFHDASRFIKRLLDFSFAANCSRISFSRKGISTIMNYRFRSTYKILINAPGQKTKSLNNPRLFCYRFSQGKQISFSPRYYFILQTPCPILKRPNTMRCCCIILLLFEAAAESER